MERNADGFVFELEVISDSLRLLEEGDTVIFGSSKDIVKQLKIIGERLVMLNATLMSARSEPKASWVMDQNGKLKCTRCEKPPITTVRANGLTIYEVEPKLKEHVPYCPKCGAKMI